MTSLHVAHALLNVDAVSADRALGVRSPSMRQYGNCMQSPRHPGGMWGVVLSGLLRWMVYGMLLSVLVLVGSAVLRRAAATQSAAANGMSGMTAAPSLPGPGSSAGYAPKEYIKVSPDPYDQTPA